MHTVNALLGAMFITITTAHMQLHSPPPFNASNNPHRTTPADPYLQFPYDCCGPHDRWLYPCRGYLSLLGTDQGKPTATWAAGSNQSWSMQGIGNHYGGSCQVGFLDDNTTNQDSGEEFFRVATSYEGNCPHRNAGDGPDGQEFDFVVPRDLKPGVTVFAWIWYNREQEFNMNCAAVNITAPGDVIDGEGNKVDQGHGSGEPATSKNFSSHDSTSTTFTTISKTLTTFTTTTVTPSRQQPGIGSGPNASPATTAAPSSSTDWATFGEGFHSVSSNSTTTIVTTIYPSSSRAITTTLSGVSAFSSQDTSTTGSGATSGPPSGLENNGRNPTSSSSAEEATTIYQTTTVTPSGMIPATAPSSPELASQGAPTASSGAPSAPSLSPANVGEASTSASSNSFSSISGVLYTSTTTTVMDIVTTTVGAPASSSSLPPVFGPAAANRTQKNVKIFRTANNCTCTCPDDDPSNIADCVCFCYHPLSRQQKQNLTTPMDSKLRVSIFSAPNTPGKNVARPDDSIMHPRGLDKARRHDWTSTTYDASPSFVPFHSRPLMLIANDGNGCVTPKTTSELKYPQPGPDVVPGDHAYPLHLPTGICSSTGEQRYHGENGNDGHM